MNDHQKTFDVARQLYPGSKRGNANEFQNFAANSLYPKNKLCKYSIKEVLPLLTPAIKTQIRWREEAKVGDFRPPWKNFQTWINDQYWELECPLIAQIPNHAKVCRTCGKVASGQANGKWHCPEHSPYARVKFIKPEERLHRSISTPPTGAESRDTSQDTPNEVDEQTGAGSESVPQQSTGAPPSVTNGSELTTPASSFDNIVADAFKYKESSKKWGAKT
jgi:hypothetical protein